jgi:hypothetical protein
MAITVLIVATVAAVAPAVGNQFTASGPFVLYGDNFTAGKKATLMRLGPSGEYLPATNKDGRIIVSDNPNMVYVDAAGIYQVGKDATPIAASVGWESQ